MMLVAMRLLALDRHRFRVATNLAEVTENGSMAGRPNRLPTVCRSTSQMIGPCEFPTKPSTRPFTSRVEALSSASWCPAYAPGGHCAYLEAGHRPRHGAHVSEEVMISSRPAEAEDRAVPGHWEGDLIIGLNRSAIGTLVERSSRFTMLMHLPRENGYGLIPRTKNGPTLGGYGAVTTANALKKAVSSLPAQLWQSLTWDRGKELSDHARFTIESGVLVFFTDPRSLWQRGTNENTNGLLRQYFPKGTDLSHWSEEEIQAVAHTLNTRPRKTLGCRTPVEALNEYLQSVQQPCVATAG